MAQNDSRDHLKGEIERMIDQVNQTERARSSARTIKYSHVPKQDPDFASYIDHTLLKLDATPAQIDKLCDEAREWKFKSVCVRVNYVTQAVAKLRGAGVDVCCVVGFHEGTYSTEEKRDEAIKAIYHDATELDFVVNHPLLRAGEYHSVHKELEILRETVARENDRVLCKLILETSQLTRDEIIAGTTLAYRTGFDFVKTSTGFMGNGARVEDVRLMRNAADLCSRDGHRSMKVKASGGIRTLQDAETMLDAGAQRLGCSAGVAIMTDQNRFQPTASIVDGQSGKNAPGDEY